jgi:hypothetical protein
MDLLTLYFLENLVFVFLAFWTAVLSRRMGRRWHLRRAAFLLIVDFAKLST